MSTGQRNLFKVATTLFSSREGSARCDFLTNAAHCARFFGSSENSAVKASGGVSGIAVLRRSNVERTAPASTVPSKEKALARNQRSKKSFMRLLAIPRSTIAWKLLRDDGFTRVGAKHRRRRIEERRVGDLARSRADRVAETYVDLEMDPRSGEASLEDHPHAVIGGVLADGGGMHLLPNEVEAIGHRNRHYLPEDPNEAVEVGRSEPEQVEVHRRPVGIPCPQREEHRTLEHEILRMR